jgi:hypothetical protein
MGPRRACLIAVVSSLFVPTAVLARRSGAHFGMLEGGVVEWKPGNQQAARKAPRRILAVPISFLFDRLGLWHTANRPAGRASRRALSFANSILLIN